MAAPKVVVLRVDGMMCQKNCGTTVTNALCNTDGVICAAARFDLGAGIALCKCSSDDLVDAIECMGFDATVVSDTAERNRLEKELRKFLPESTVILAIEGMMCQKNCGKTVRNALNSVDGVQSTVVSFPAGAAMVRGTGISPEELMEAVDMMGFDATHVQDADRVSNLVDELTRFSPGEEIGALSSPAQSAPPIPPPKPAKFQREDNVIVLAIEGMMCQKNCGTTIQRCLQGVAGTSKAIVSFPLNAALIEGKASSAEYINEIECIGFDASVVTDPARRFALLSELQKFAAEKDENAQSREVIAAVVLSVEGMMCQKNCGTTVRNCLVKVPGVSKAVVSFSAHAALVEGSAAASDLIDAIESIGFDATVVADAMQQASLTSELRAFDTTNFELQQQQKQQQQEEEEEDKQLPFEPQEQEALPLTRRVSFDLEPDSLSDSLGGGGSGSGIDRRRRAEVAISGMTCTACVSNVERNIGKLDGVYQIAVALIAEKATIEYDNAKLSGLQVAHAVDALGYKATLLEDDLPCDVESQQGIGKLVLIIYNLSSNVNYESELVVPLEKLPGVVGVHVDLARSIVKISFTQEHVGSRDLFEFVERSGFPCELTSGDEGGNAGSGDEVSLYYKRMFFGSLVFTIPIIFISMVCPHIAFIMALLSLPTGLGIDWHSLLLWLLSTPVQFIFARRFYRNAYKAIRNGAANMDVLVVLGTSSAYLYSMISLLVSIAKHKSSEEAGRDAHFFETSAMLITFILMGKYLESSARGRTADAITALMDMQAENAILVPGGPGEGESGSNISARTGLHRRLSANSFDSRNNRDTRTSTDSIDEMLGHTKADLVLPPASAERVIDLRLVQVGDILKVLPGQAVPVDGIVTYGESAVDESMLTGEAAPVVKVVGSPVTGSTSNGHGLLYMRATRVGSDTALAQIMRLVEDAQTSKAPIQEYTDRISQWFVPAVVTLACVTWIGWFLVVFGSTTPPAYLDGMKTSDMVVFAFKFGVAVLVISCPCALGLATPTAVMVSTGVGAAHGILIKGAEAIESGSKVTAVVFDKTGTLTQGKPSVSGFLNLSASCTDAAVLELLGTAELASEHPVAKAVSAYAANFPGVSMASGAPSKFEALPGLGIDCRISVPPSSSRPQASVRVLIGNRKLMLRHKVALPDEIDQFLKENEKMGTVIIAAMDRWLKDGGHPQQSSDLVATAAIAVCDPINENASYVVSLLRTLKIKVYMLSGDNVTTAEECAKRCGIPSDHVFANCLPKQKSNRISKLQSAGEIVAMVGDGVNDSPALTLSDLGIAVGAGTDIAIKAADVVLIRSNLLDVAIFIDLARTTLRRIKINLFFSFVYNMMCIPLAAGIFYPSLHLRLPPALAGFMMSLSSVTVVVSSLLLRYYKPPQTMDVEFRPPESKASNLKLKSVPEFDSIRNQRSTSDLSDEEEGTTIESRSAWGRAAGYMRVNNLQRRNSTSSQTRFEDIEM